MWDEATDEAEDRSGVRVQVLDSDKTKTQSTVALHSSSFLNWTRDSRLREQMARRQEQKVGPLLYSRIRKCVLQLLNNEVFPPIRDGSEARPICRVSANRECFLRGVVSNSHKICCFPPSRAMETASVQAQGPVLCRVVLVLYCSEHNYLALTDTDPHTGLDFALLMYQ